MSFPTISDADTKNGVQTSNSPSWMITHPTNIAAGDLLLLFIATDGGLSPASATGFSQNTASAAGGCTLTLLCRKADGTETGTFTTTIAASEQGGWRIFRIPAASWFGGSVVDGQAIDTDSMSVVFANSSSGNPNPPSNNPANWATEDTLWIAACCIDTSRTISAYPLTDRNTANVSGGSTGATLGLCTSAQAVGSLDPGTFTSSASDDWVALTLAVRPAAQATKAIVFPKVTNHLMYRKRRIIPL